MVLRLAVIFTHTHTYTVESYVAIESQNERELCISAIGRIWSNRIWFDSRIFAFEHVNSTSINVNCTHCMYCVVQQKIAGDGKWTTAQHHQRKMNWLSSDFFLATKIKFTFNRNNVSHYISLSNVYPKQMETHMSRLKYFALSHLIFTANVSSSFLHFFFGSCIQKTIYALLALLAYVWKVLKFQYSLCEQTSTHPTHIIAHTNLIHMYIWCDGSSYHWLK